MQGLQGDLGSISGLGRSSGEGTGYSPQYFWASPVAQTVKNLPVVLETWVRSLGWEDPLEEGMAAHSSIPAWRIPWTEEPGGLQSMGSPRVKHVWATEDRAAQPVYSRIIHIGWEHFVSCPQDPQEETSSETLQLFCSPDSHPQRSRGVSPTLGKSDEACSAPPASSWEPAFHRSHACSSTRILLGASVPQVACLLALFQWCALPPCMEGSREFPFCSWAFNSNKRNILVIIWLIAFNSPFICSEFWQENC